MKTPVLDEQGRRKRHTATSTGKFTRLGPQDVARGLRIHRLGPQTKEMLHLLTPEYGKSLKATGNRLMHLFHEDQTPHGGRYLTRPFQQVMTLNPNANSMVYDITPCFEQALRELGEFREHAPRTSNQSWDHDFGVSFIASNLLLGTLTDPNEWAYIYHDEVVERIGTEKFEVGKDTIRPDRFAGIHYLPTNSAIYFLIEFDKATEPHRSKSKDRHKSTESSIKLYHEFLDNNLYKKWFGPNRSVMLLDVTTSQNRMNNKMDLHCELTGGSNKVLYKNIPEFQFYFDPPKPKPELFLDPWSRAGKPSFSIATL